MKLIVIIAKTFKTHWFILVAVMLVQYLTGKIMAGESPIAIPLRYRSTITEAHEFLGTILLLASAWLAAAKIYMIIRQKRITAKVKASSQTPNTD